MEDEEDMALAGVVLEQEDFERALDIMQSAHSDAIGAPKVLVLSCGHCAVFIEHVTCGPVSNALCSDSQYGAG